MAHDDSIGAGYSLSYPLALTFMACLAVVWYMVIELTVVIFTTSKRRSGPYFYSLLIATWGIVPIVFGCFLKFYQITRSAALYTAFVAIGWPMMVIGQSLVLYSRVNLPMRNTGRWVLVMIIVDAAICHIPMMVLMYDTSSLPNPEMYAMLYTVYEKVQVTVFFLQEVTISGFSLYRTRKLLGDEGNIRDKNSRKVMTHLVWVNIFIIALDMTFLGVEYSGHYDMQTTYKAAVYSIKLKMEFSFLNWLMDLFQGRIQDGSLDRSHNTHTHFTSNNFTPNKFNRRPSFVVGSLEKSDFARIDDMSLVNPSLSKFMEVVKTVEVTVEITDITSGVVIDEMDGSNYSCGGSGIRQRLKS